MSNEKKNRFTGRGHGHGAGTGVAPAKEKETDGVEDSATAEETAKSAALLKSIHDAAVTATAGAVEICARIADSTVVVEETEEANMAAARTRAAIVERLRELSGQTAKESTEQFFAAVNTELENADVEETLETEEEEKEPQRGEIGEVGEHGEHGDLGTNTPGR